MFCFGNLENFGLSLGGDDDWWKREVMLVD